MLLIFDLDGTLIDSRLDLACAVNATRAQAGRGPLPHQQIFSFVGNGAPVLIKRSMGPEASDEEVRNALEFFLDYYRHHALDYTVLYPGINDALNLLYASGASMAVLTNKPVRISHRIMEGLGIASFFFKIYGGNSFEHKKPHPIGIDTLRAEADAQQDTGWWAILTSTCKPRVTPASRPAALPGDFNPKPFRSFRLTFSSTVSKTSPIVSCPPLPREGLSLLRNYRGRDAG